jgi:hypothetical protein
VTFSVNTLVERLEAFLYARGSSAYRAAAGLTGGISYQKLYRDFPELAHTDTYRELKESVDNPRYDPERKHRLRLVLGFFAGVLEEAAAIAPLDAQEEVLAAEVPGFSGQSLRELLQKLERAPDRAQREAMAKAAHAELTTHQTAWRRRVDAQMQLAETLKASSWQAFRASSGPFALDGFASLETQVLRRSADAYRDLLGYVLKHAHPEAPIENPALHDVQYASSAPWIRDSFRPEDALTAVTRCLEDMGLPPNAAGRLSVDSEPREGKRSGVHLGVLKAPDEVRLVIAPQGHLSGLAELLGGFGAALYHAHVSPRLHLPERSLVDPTLPSLFSCLFSRVLTDEHWYRRYLRLGAPAAREAARLAAFRQLFELRWLCVRAQHSLEVYERGPLPPLANSFEERGREAMQVSVPRERYLYDLQQGLDVFAQLRAIALEAGVHRYLQHKFNEDFWRNPATGRWLSGLAATGQADATEKMVAPLTANLQAFDAASDRLVRVMAA